MDDDELREKIDELEDKILKQTLATASLADSIQEVIKNQFELTRFIDAESKVEFNILMQEQIKDVVLKDFFYYFTFFESVDGWANQGATVSVASNRLYVDPSGTTTGYAKKKAILQNALTYDNTSSFGTSFQISSALYDGDLITNTKAYFGTGHAITGGSNNLLDDGLDAGTHYGFYLEDDILYGVTSNGSKETKTKLISGIKFGESLSLRATFFPRDRVDFYASEPESGVNVSTAQIMGSASSNLPTGIRNGIGEFSIQDTTGTTGQAMNIGYCEILQERKK